MKKSNLFFAFLALTTLFSCETDIEINAPYKDIPVVYGLIDPAVDTQYVRITKAFLGDNNAYDLAADANNFNYPDGELDVVVQEINSSGNVVTTHTLVRTVNEVIKDAGTFDNSENVLFRFVEPNINTDNTYRLVIYNNDLEKEITAETLIIKNSIVSDPVNPGLKFQFWSGTVATGVYLDKVIKVTTASNIGRIDATLNFNYRDYFTTSSGLSYVEKTVKMPLGEEIAPTPLGNDVLEWELAGSTFFDNITNNVPDPSTIPFLSHREIRNISMEFNVAGTELSTFMAVSEPSTSVNQEKPTYTNIDGGLGIFSSRSLMLWNSTIDTDLLSQINVQNSTIRFLQSLNKGFCFGTTGVGFPVAPCTQQP